MLVLLAAAAAAAVAAPAAVARSVLCNMLRICVFVSIFCTFLLHSGTLGGVFSFFPHVFLPSFFFSLFRMSQKTNVNLEYFERGFVMLATKTCTLLVLSFSSLVDLGVIRRVRRCVGGAALVIRVRLVFGRRKTKRNHPRVSTRGEL